MMTEFPASGQNKLGELEQVVFLSGSCVVQNTHLPLITIRCVPYVSQSLLSQGAEGQDDSNDGHSLQHAVDS